MEHVIALHAEWLYACGSQDLTVQSRYFCLTGFAQWCIATVAGNSFRMVDRDLLCKFFAHLKDRALAGYTVKNYKISLTRFFDFLIQSGCRGDNPMESLRVRPRIEAVPVATLREDELHALLQAADRRYQHVPAHNQAAKLHALRDKVLLLLLVATGLRACEVAGLKIGDVDLEQGLLRIRGKGFGYYVKRNRIAFIDHPALLTDLRHYLALRAAPADSPLFLTQLRTSVQASEVRRILQGLARRAGLTRRIYAHLFRHSFCCHLVSQGADAFSVQKLMGHYRIEVTFQYYLHLTPAEVRLDWKTHNPLCREVSPC